MTEMMLNPNQQAVVDAEGQAVLVVAGPGAGNTTVLQARIQRILENSASSKFRVLGITYTTAAAEALRRKIESLERDAQDRVQVNTFHAFAARVLQHHGTHIGLSQDFTIISSDADRAVLLSEALKREEISGEPRKYLKLLTGIYEAGRALDDIREEIGSGSAAVARLASRYVEVSKEKAQLDFPLLVYCCIELFRTYPALPKQLRRVYKHICVDEFQDTNDAQYKLLTLLTGDSADDLVLLADQDQLIYQWNGASPERLREANQQFHMRVINLPTSFRCPNEILNPANRLISHNASRFIAPEFHSENVPAGTITVRSFENEIAEREALAEYLLNIPETERGQTVVIARARKALDAAFVFCENKGLPVMKPAPRYEFESAPLTLLHNILRLAAVPGNDSALERISGAFYEMVGRRTDPDLIRGQATAEGREPLDVFFGNLRPLAASSEFAKLCDVVSNELVARREFRHVSAALFEWVQQVTETRVRNAHPQTGYLASYELEKALWEEFERQNRGLESERVPLREFVQALDLASKTPTLPNHIAFVTAHGAKGLEFTRVYVVAAAESQFPTFQAVDLGDKSAAMEEERRSFFVAITRCSRDLTISYASRYSGWQHPPSRFLAEMGVAKA